MRINLKNHTGQNIDVVMRDLRYHAWGNAGEQKQFIRPLATGGAYPRFHVYLRYNSQTKEISLTLHFDQRQTVYQGTTAHHGEYDGELVEKEAERIKQKLK
ncbi:MAG: hypothetical protein Q8N61_00950 [bacterium]|nr:hypothetical protein [bacterium]